MPSIDTILAQGVQPTTAWKSPTAIQQEQANLDLTQAHAQQQQLVTQQAIEAKRIQDQRQKAWLDAFSTNPDDPGKAYLNRTGDVAGYDNFLKVQDAHKKALADAHETDLKAQGINSNAVYTALSGALSAQNPDEQAFNLANAAKVLKQGGYQFEEGALSNPTAAKAYMGMLDLEGRALKDEVARREIATKEKQAETAAQNATSKSTANEISLNKSGLRTNPDTGTVEAIPYEELPAEAKSRIDKGKSLKNHQKAKSK